MWIFDLFYIPGLYGFFVGFLCGCFLVLGLFYLLAQEILQSAPKREPFKVTRKEPKIPASLSSALENQKLTSPQVESALIFNLLLHFLFHQIKDELLVKRFVLLHLKKECALILQQRVGVLLKNLRIISFDVGENLPVCTNFQLVAVDTNNDETEIERVLVSFDMVYTGQFELDIDAQLVLNRSAKVHATVRRIEGPMQIAFTKQPQTHWSLAFRKEPQLELDVNVYVEGRLLWRLGQLLQMQVRKKISAVHTLPHYKVRYAPFFRRGTLPNIFTIDAYGRPIVAPSAPSPAIAAVRQTPNPPTKSRSLSLDDLAKLSRRSFTFYMNLSKCNFAPLLNALDSRANIFVYTCVNPLPWEEMISITRQLWLEHVLVVSKERHDQMIGITCHREYIMLTCQFSMVISVVEKDSLAAKGGLVKGDVISAINNKPVGNLRQLNRLLKDYDHLEMTVRRFSPELKRRLEEEVRRRCLGGTEFALTERGAEPLKEQLIAFVQQQSNQLDVKARPSADLPVGGLDCFPSFSLPGTEAYALLEQRSVDSLQWDSWCRFNDCDPRLTFSLTVWTKTSVVKTADVSVDATNAMLLGFLSLPLQQVLKSTITSASSELLQLSAASELDQNTTGETVYKKSCSLQLSFRDSLEGLSATVLDAVSLCMDTERKQPDYGGDGTDHSFVVASLSSSVACCFCGKRIWFKSGVQCKRCAMVCHKRCAAQCLSSTRCGRQGAPSSSLESLNVTDIASPLPQHGPLERDADGHKSGDREMSIVAADAIPLGTAQKSALAVYRLGKSGLSYLKNRVRKGRPMKSLPPDVTLPRSINTVERVSDIETEKQLLLHCLDLADNGDRFFGEILGRYKQSVENVNNWKDNNRAVSAAKELSRELYDDLPLDARKQKISDVIDKLMEELDREMQLRSDLAEQLHIAGGASESTDAGDVLPAEISGDQKGIRTDLERCDARIQALSYLMLHYCSGLQYCKGLGDGDVAPMRDILTERPASAGPTPDAQLNVVSNSLSQMAELQIGWSSASVDQQQLPSTDKFIPASDQLPFSADI